MNINDVPDLMKQAKNKTVLLDVREPDEYAGGHLPGAINLPMSSLLGRTHEFHKTDNLILYCETGSRSKVAKMVFGMHGYKHVTNAGGISDYTGELETGKVRQG